MSTSTKSEAASPDSPPSGSPTAVAVDFEVYRGSWIGWLVIGAVLGVLLLLNLGTIGRWMGVLLLLYAVWNGVKLAQSLLHKPGTIEVSADRIVVPRGLCRGNPLVLKPADVSAAYFLRNSVPWNRSAPLLIIEAQQEAHSFPRDWFSSEADQRRIISAIVALKGESVEFGAERPPEMAKPPVSRSVL